MPLVLHLGLGAFHRAHQAAYLQRLHDLGDQSWRLVSGDIRPGAGDAATAIEAQGQRYTLETIEPGGARSYATIDVLTAVPYMKGIPALLAAGASADTRIISFTVTEAGYFLDAEDRLGPALPDIAADLATLRTGGTGTTVYGALAAILRARIASGGGPVTLLSCDNLRHNGARFRSGFRQFLTMLRDEALRAWVDANTSCPCAMVDRITPRPGPELAGRVLGATGRIDRAAVMSESFIQWVIEDDFRSGRPDWEKVGVQIVPDVAPFEEAKIRILNASHSAIAWAGTLAGTTFIHEGMREPRIAALVATYVNDGVFDCLRGGPIDLASYRNTVLQRFASDAIADTNVRVIADSFSKLPGFIVPTIRDRLARGLDLAGVAALPALFLLFLQRCRSGALAIDYQDQAMDLAVVDSICASADPVAAFCALPVVWDELAGDPRLVQAIRLASDDMLYRFCR